MGMNDQESLSFSAEQTRRNLLKMGAIAAPAVAVTLATTKGAVAGQGMNNLGGNDNNQDGNNNNQGGTRPAPVPSIGVGLPVVLVLGGVSLGTKLISRWRQFKR